MHHPSAAREEKRDAARPRGGRRRHERNKRRKRREERSRFPGGISPALLTPPPRHSVIFYWVYDVINLIASSSHQGLIATYLKAVDTLSGSTWPRLLRNFRSASLQISNQIYAPEYVNYLGFSAFPTLLPFVPKDLALLSRLSLVSF